jgi:hypothetical protein
MDVATNNRHVKHIKPGDSARVRSALVRLLTTYIPLERDARELNEATMWNILLL